MNAADHQLLRNFQAAPPIYRDAALEVVWTRRQTGHPWEPILLTAYFFTDDPRLWAYAHASLAALRDFCAFRF